MAVPELPTAARGAAVATAASEQELRDGGYARIGWVYVSLIEGSDSGTVDAARRTGSERGAELVRVESSGSRAFGGGEQAVSPSGHMTSASARHETIVIVSLWRRAPDHAHDPPVFGAAWRDTLVTLPSRDIHRPRVARDAATLTAGCDAGDTGACLELAWPDYRGPAGPARDRAVALYIEACALGVHDACVTVANYRR